MSSRHSPDDEDTLDSGPALSGEAVTPRGGFMARPGLKAPPRHAVVVRGGNAPESDDIPRARSSCPPPPASVPAPVSASEKITLRAIPTPSPPPAGLLAPSRPAVVDSLPPPSDAAVVASTRASTSRRGRGSRWMIVAAATAGLLLGFASVAGRMRAAGVAAHPQAGDDLSRPASVGAPATPAPVSASASAGSNAPAASSRAAADDRVSPEPKAPRAANPGAKRSIF